MSDPDARYFVVVSGGRTGSTMLESILNTNADIVSGAEIVNDVDIREGRPVELPPKLGPVPDDTIAELTAIRARDPVEFLGRYAELARAAGFSIVGFKMLYGHALRVPAVVDHLTALRGLRVIHLKRRDRLRRFLSLKRAYATWQWSVGRDAGSDSHSSKEPPPARQPLELDWDECVEDFAAMRDMEQWCDDAFGDSEILTVTYEDLLTDREPTARAVLDFLGAAPTVGEPWTVRQNTATLRESIRNYDELKARAAGTEWARWFVE